MRYFTFEIGSKKRIEKITQGNTKKRRHVRKVPAEDLLIGFDPIHFGHSVEKKLQKNYMQLSFTSIHSRQNDYF